MHDGGDRVDGCSKRRLRALDRLESRAHQRGIGQLRLERLGLLEPAASLLQLGLAGEILFIAGKELRLGLLKSLEAVVMLDPAHAQAGIALLELLTPLLESRFRRGIHGKILAVGLHIPGILLVQLVISLLVRVIVVEHGIDLLAQERGLLRLGRERLDIGILFSSVVGGLLDTDAAGDQRDRADRCEKRGQKARQSRMAQVDPLRAARLVFSLRILLYKTIMKKSCTR